MTAVVSTRVLKGSSVYSTRTMDNSSFSNDIESLKANIASHGSKIQSNTDNLTAINENVNSNAGTLNIHEARLGEIEDALLMDGSGTVIDMIQTNLSSAQTNVTNLLNDAAIIKPQVQTNTSTIETHQTKIETLEEQVSNLELNQEDLRTEINENVGERIDELESNQSELLEQVETSINTRIDGLEEAQSKISNLHLINLWNDLEEVIYDTSRYEVDSDLYNTAVTMKNYLPQFKALKPKNIYDYHLLNCSNVDRIRTWIDYFDNYPTPEDGRLLFITIMYGPAIQEEYNAKEFHELVDESKVCPFETMLTMLDNAKNTVAQFPDDQIQSLLQMLPGEVETLLTQAQEQAANPKTSKHEQIIKNRDDIATLTTSVSGQNSIIEHCETTVNEMMGEIGFIQHADVKIRCENAELFEELCELLHRQGSDNNCPDFETHKEFRYFDLADARLAATGILNRWRNATLTYEHNCSQTENINTLIADINSKLVDGEDVNHVLLYTRTKFLYWLNEFVDPIRYTDQERSDYTTCPFAEMIATIRTALDEASTVLEGREVMDVLNEIRSQYYHYQVENYNYIMKSFYQAFRSTKTTVDWSYAAVQDLQTQSTESVERITALETQSAESVERITALETQSTESVERITALETQINELPSITDLQTQLAEALERITALEAQLAETTN